MGKRLGSHRNKPFVSLCDRPILARYGVPLPLVSYGGSAMLTMLIGCGLILSVALHRGLSIPRKNAFG